MFDAVLIANRGEIALRVVRACRELGVRAVAVHSEADGDAPHVRAADEAHLLGPTPAAQSYLDVDRLLEVARATGVDAVHPGYGFLSENADAARAVADAGVTWIGPPPDAIARMGDKLSARAVAEAAEVPVVPGTTEPTDDPAVALAFGESHGYPVAVKAMFGGGGRGMKVVRTPDAMAAALEAARREATASFGRGECYLERYLDRPRHVEVQVLGDLDGTVVHLGERDCSLQRRHQKLVEEAPAPGVSRDLRDRIGQAAIRIAVEMGYHSAGTCEFLLDADGETFYFLEMNTRLQVEHPVTELVTGIDLVHAQLRIAAGDGMGLTQADVALRGHAIECRINAEDPGAGFAPTPGRVDRLRVADGPGVRFDGGVAEGDTITSAYDSMIGKLVVWAPTRHGAVHRMGRALAEMVVEGVPTTVPFHRLAMGHPEFRAGRHHTASVEQEWDLAALPGPTTSAPPPPPSDPARPVREVALTIGGRAFHVAVHGRAASSTTGRDPGVRRRGASGADRAATADDPQLRSPMQGTVVAYAVEVGDTVTAGELVCVVEAMKMENHVAAHRDGVVTRLMHAIGDVIEPGAAVARIEDPA